MIRRIFPFLAFLSVFFANINAHSKIYDCFMFFNEIELLKMRLEELDELVDFFVLVESVETQRGDSKPLYFNENRQLFERYLDRIIHVIVDERHPEMGLWEREGFQRNCIARGLQNCAESDVIMISDLDEIPRVEAVREVLKLLPTRNARILQKAKEKKFKRHNKKSAPGKVEKMHYLNAGRALVMSLYFFQLNRQPLSETNLPGGSWCGTIITTYGVFDRLGAQHFRDFRWKFPRVYGAGWHFTWMGGKDKIRKKICSIVEGGPEGAKASDDELEQLINNYPPVPIDHRFPNYVLRNFDYLKSIGFIADY